ncbi:hypothetical protein E2R68_02880 [Psychromonas sp. RZ22]|uniref:hypothetical protein n=1 Tax=Psychromonas algarum TaxID=2555643 RepID=UPI0010687049|nr:hypothetical protein [Psychromonas sp. RZ22]TEW56051.1 hypothetical protein E2R68_02880 [Psychromonas sp. RZ22]
MTILSCETTTRLEQEIRLFSQKIYHKGSAQAEIVKQYENRKKVEQFKINLICNTALNIGLIICLGSWLIL